MRSFWFWLASLVLLSAWTIFYVLIPPFHAPDEYSHYTYIQALAHGHLPYLTKADCWSEEVHFFVDRYKEGDKTILYAPRVDQPVPKNLDDTATCSTQAQHPPLYYSLATIVYKTVSFFGLTGLDRYNLVRFVSLGFFVLFLIYASKLFGLFFDEKLVRLMRLLLILQPMLLSLSTHVNPEIAAVTLCTVTLYYISLFLLKKQFTTQQILILAGLCVVTFYAKVTGIIMVPLTAFAIMFLTKNTWLQKLQQLFLLGTIVAIGISPYLAWNYHLYGKPLESGLMYLQVVPNFPEKISQTMKFFYVLDDVQIGLRQTAGDVGRLDAPFFSEVRITYLFVLVVLFSAGLYAALTQPKLQAQWQMHRWLFALHVLLTLTFYTYLGYDYMQAAWIGPLLQARYVFVGVGSFLLFCFLGALQFINVDRYKLFKFFVLVSVLHFNVVVLWSIIPRFYL